MQVPTSASSWMEATNFVCVGDQTGVKLSQPWSKSSFWRMIQPGRAGGFSDWSPALPHLHGKCSGLQNGADRVHLFLWEIKGTDKNAAPATATSSEFHFQRRQQQKTREAEASKAFASHQPKNAAEIKIVASNKTNNIQRDNAGKWNLNKIRMEEE